MPRSPAEIADALHSHPYFAPLDPDSLGALAQRAIVRTFGRGEAVLMEGEPAGPLLVLLSGRVKVYKSSADGRELVLAVLGSGQGFNDVAAFDAGPNSASAEALSDVELIALPGSEFRRAVHEHPGVALAALKGFAARLRQVTSLAEDLALRSVTERLAKLLLQQAELVGEMTQQEMAASVGTVREVVARSLRTLADDGLIRIERHRIIIIDRRALARVAGLWGDQSHSQDSAAGLY